MPCYGSSRAGCEKAHGEPLGEDNIRATKKAYGWPEDAQFLVPDGVAEAFHGAIAARGQTARKDWEAMFERYSTAHPDLAAEFTLLHQGKIADGWAADISVFPADAKGLASRDAGGKVLNAIAPARRW